MDQPKEAHIGLCLMISLPSLVNSRSIVIDFQKCYLFIHCDRHYLQYPVRGPSCVFSEVSYHDPVKISNLCIQTMFTMYFLGGTPEIFKSVGETESNITDHKIPLLHYQVIQQWKCPRTNPITPVYFKFYLLSLWFSHLLFKLPDRNLKVLNGPTHNILIVPHWMEFFL